MISGPNEETAWLTKAVDGSKKPLELYAKMYDDNGEVAMKTYRLIKLLLALFMLAPVFSGCSIVSPTPALPVSELTKQPSQAQPAATPNLPPAVNCTADSDCVLAYRTDHCCACGSIYNREEVENNRRLRYVNEPEGYRYEEWRLPRRICLMMMCAPCPQPPFGLVCDAGACREVQTWQEIWSACGEIEYDQKIWCHVNAAQTAYQAGEEDQAVKICNDLQGNYPGGVDYAEDCILQVARTIMTNDPEASATFCRSHLTVLLSHCLNETAFAVGRTDVESALALCNEITIQTGNDQNQKNYCFHNVAMSVAKMDLEQARQICEMMSQDVEQCKTDAEHPQGIP